MGVRLWRRQLHELRILYLRAGHAANLAVYLYPGSACISLYVALRNADRVETWASRQRRPRNSEKSQAGGSSGVHSLPSCVKPWGAGKPGRFDRVLRSFAPACGHSELVGTL
eukprot:1946941-Alexandrium_andersonii.AAC.1